MADAHLSALAKVLDYPEDFFFQRTRVQGSGQSEVFHRKRNKAPVSVMQRSYAEAQVRRLQIGRMFQSMIRPPNVPSYPIDEFEDDPEKIARTVRAYWQLPAGPVYNVTRTLEENGCMVLSHDFGSRHVDGFSHRSADSPPFFHLNAMLPPDRWRWTLAHELGHIVMHIDPGESHQVVEKQADRFAAEFLAPSHEILPLLFRLNLRRLAALKLEWKISMQALVMRAHDLGTIDSRQKTRWFATLNKEGYLKREPTNLDPPVEKPAYAYELTQYFAQDMGFSRAEICAMLLVNEVDFQRFYHDPDDLLGEILLSPSESDAMVKGVVQRKFETLDISPNAPPLHIQVGCHPEDIARYQKALDAILLLRDEGFIPEPILGVGVGRLKLRLEQEFTTQPTSDLGLDWDIDDLIS